MKSNLATFSLVAHVSVAPWRNHCLTQAHGPGLSVLWGFRASLLHTGEAPPRRTLHTSFSLSAPLSYPLSSHFLTVWFGRSRDWTGGVEAAEDTDLQVRRGTPCAEGFTREKPVKQGWDREEKRTVQKCTHGAGWQLRQQRELKANRWGAACRWAFTWRRPRGTGSPAAGPLQRLPGRPAGAAWRRPRTSGSRWWRESETLLSTETHPGGSWRWHWQKSSRESSL